MIIRIKSSKNMEQENVIKRSNAENNRAYRERKGGER
jgi:hypothetical protein